MVSVANLQSDIPTQLTAGLSAQDSQRVLDAYDFVMPLYVGKSVVTGQGALDFAQGVATTLASLKGDAETIITGMLFELPVINAEAAENIETRFGKDVIDLVTGTRQLMRLRELTFGQQSVGRGKNAAQEAATQIEDLAQNGAGDGDRHAGRIGATGIACDDPALFCRAKTAERDDA